MCIGLVLAGSTACSLSLGDASDWVPADELTGVLAPELEGQRFAPPTGNAVLRVLTFNVRLGGNTEGLVAAFTENENLANADVLMLQEIEAYGSEGQSRTRRLADRLGMNFVYAPARQEGGDGTHGIALLSWYQLVGVETMQLPFADESFRGAGLRWPPRSPTVNAVCAWSPCIWTCASTSQNACCSFIRLRKRRPGRWSSAAI